MVDVAMSDVQIITLVIAAYAALVATVGAAVQLATYVSRRTKLEVRVSVKRIYQPLVLLGPTQAVVAVHLVNRSAHPVKVNLMWFCAQRAGEPSLLVPTPLPEKDSLPKEIPPRDSTMFWVLPDTLKTKLDLNRGVRAAVATADDRTFLSKRVTLRFGQDD